MNRKLRTSCLLPLLLVACSRPSPTPHTSERSAYLSACASCHGADGRGSGPAAKALRKAPADLTLLAARNGGVFPREAVVAVVVGERPLAPHGSREMPVWSTRFGPSAGATAVASVVAQRRVEAIVDYVESLQRTDAR